VVQPESYKVQSHSQNIKDTIQKPPYIIKDKFHFLPMILPNASSRLISLKLTDCFIKVIVNECTIQVTISLCNDKKALQNI